MRVKGTPKMATLEWRESHIVGDDQCFEADTEWRKPFGVPDYLVYSWKGGWSYSRPDHPILGKLSGAASTIVEAQAICEDDYGKQQRLRRWHQYMLENDPPGER